MKTHFINNCLVLGIILLSGSLYSQDWKVNSNQWSATDALGRTTPEWYETGETRDGKYVGMFYWTWHTDNLAEFDPVLNLREILEEHPEAIDDFDHPAWQGISPGVYFWDEPLFGYYRTTDEWILRKHAEMLADAGVDVVFCDATNGNYTWKSAYTKLLEVWDQARKDGVKTPQFAFLLPFGPTPGGLESLYEIYTDLYEPGLYQDLWFMWKGKPLIMAYPETANMIPPSDAAGLKFTASSEFTSVGALCPSWSDSIGNLTLSLYEWNGSYQTSVAQQPLVVDTFVNFPDNAYLDLEFDTLQAGDYVWELNGGTQTVGVWKFIEDTDSTFSYFNSVLVAGDYNSRIKYTSHPDFTPLTTGDYATHVPVQIKDVSMDPAKLSAIKDFFTFRPGQGDYVSGPTRPDHWGWLEVYPQHGYKWNSSTGYEQVTVGIAQNASDISGGRCTSFNGPGTYGRSYTQRNGWDTRDSAFLRGANFEEQWDRAFELDPELVWITGWNEWIMGRHKDWPGCSGGSQVVNGFPDAFDAERSRDIEPAKSWGPYGDVYYVQLVENVRKFKGMEKRDTVSEEKSIDIGAFNGWDDVKPEFWHYRGNTMERNHKGHGQSLVYTNTTGRNDIVLAKVARDNEFVYFHVQTDEDLTQATEPGWMRLFIDIDRDKQTGWEGYDYVVNRVSPGNKALLESSTGDWTWTEADSVEYAVSGNALELKIPRSSLGLAPEDELDLEFKWSDNMQEEGNIMDFYVNGDAAPGGRWNFVYSTIQMVNSEYGSRMASGLFSRSYPNPFQSATTFEFEMTGTSDVRLWVYNSMGQQVKNLTEGSFPTGIHQVRWNGCDENGNRVDPGIYFFRFTTGQGSGGTFPIVKTD